MQRSLTPRRNDTNTPKIPRMELAVGGLHRWDAEENRPPRDGDAENEGDGEAARLADVGVG